LHSRMEPVELIAKPEPVTETLWPPERFEFGVTAIVGFADADADIRNIAPNPATSSAARPIEALLSRLLRRI
jgi:hypothetical protein